MTDNVSRIVITGRRMNGPERPVPLTGTNLASFGVAEAEVELIPRPRDRSCPADPGCSPSDAPSCSSERSIKALHRAFGRGVSITRRVRRIVRFGIDLCSGSKRELSGHDDCFVELDTA